MRLFLCIFLICFAALTSPAAAEYPTIEELVETLGIRESQIPSRDMPGWSRPGKVTVLVWDALPESGPGSREWLLEASDGVEVDIMVASQTGFDLDRLAGSDVYIGWCFANAISSIEELDYIHIFSAGLDRCTSIPGFVESNPIATNSAKAASETIAEHSVALMLAVTRNLPFHHSAQLEIRVAGRRVTARHLHDVRTGKNDAGTRAWWNWLAGCTSCARAGNAGQLQPGIPAAQDQVTSTM